jgi:hypothetical protein
MEQATSRTIRIGAANIGLIGLDTALNELSTKSIAEKEAVDTLYEIVSAGNYIPAGHEKQYRTALLNEYRKHISNDFEQPENMVVRIFGSSCISCNTLQTMMIQILDQTKLAADIEQIHDPDEIGRYGVLHTPALMVNGEIKCQGRMPTAAQLEQWVREAE